MLSTKGSAALQVNQIRAGAALSYVSMALSTVISLVYTPIMLRQLGDSEFGVYQAVLPIISYLNLLSFGLGSAYVRYYSRFRAAGDKKGCAKLNGMFLITYLILGAMVLAIGFGLSYCDVVFGKKLTAEEIDLAQRLLRIMSVNGCADVPHQRVREPCDHQREVSVPEDRSHGQAGAEPPHYDPPAADRLPVRDADHRLADLHGAQRRDQHHLLPDTAENALCLPALRLRAAA